MFGGFKSSKCNTLCRMSVSRIKLLKNKRNITIKNMRREVAQLLRDKKTEYARIRVEAVMREDATNQVLEILELFLELVSVRVALIAKTKEMPHDMEEAIASIIYASKRLLELQELPQIAALFASKYGKQYVAEASSDEHADDHRVNQRLRQCLSVEPPDAMDKLQVLKDIGEEHEVEVDIPRLKAEMMPRVGQFTHMPVFSDEPGGTTTMQASDGQGGGLFMPGEIPGMVSTAPSEPPPAAAFRPAAGAAATAPPPAADQAPNLPPINPNFAPPVVPTEPTEPFAGALAAATGGAQNTELGSYPAIPGPGAGGGSKMYDTAKDGISYGMPAAAQPPPTSGSNMYVIPSADELQRRYDAAPGPPTKTTGAAPPSAPPPPAGTDLPSTPVALPSAGGLSGMPAPPTTDPSLPSAHNESVPGLHPQRPSADGGDLDDLQARWEALKRR